MRFFLLTILSLSVFCNSSAAQDAALFGSPINCSIGKDCWVLNYADRTPDADKQAVDNACLSRSYDGHKGTDFAIADEAAMKKGVDVLAARDGKVTRVRNTEDDRFPTSEQLLKTKADKKECGNAVLIEHGNGWQSLYCHLKKNSVRVKIGDMVKTGDKIAMVGLSGYTQFPHVHFGVIQDGKVIDPFSGTDIATECTQPQNSLWAPETNIKYEEVVFLNAGFDTKPPSLEQLDRGHTKLDKVSTKSTPALIFHTVIGGAREGDEIHLVIRTPDNSIFAERSIKQDKNRARQMVFVGRKTDQVFLKEGNYKGIVTIKREDKIWQQEIIIATAP